MLFSIGTIDSAMAQKKREIGNQGSARMGGNGIGKSWGGLFSRKKQMGNANDFARGKKKRGLFGRASKNTARQPWVYRKTPSGEKERREWPKLYKRSRTNNKKRDDRILAKQRLFRKGDRELAKDSYFNR